MEISVALGGGGIKGIAHIGVLDCLEEAGFKIHTVAGTSVGGLIGAVYAAGYTPDEITEVIQSLQNDRLYARQRTDGPSLLGYTGLAEIMTEILGENQFSDLKLPFACTAVDLRTAQEVYLSDGRVIDAVMATIAVPGIFPSTMRGEVELIDGGVLDPVPVNLARCMAPTLPVVAVALNPERDQWHHLPQFNIVPPVPLPIPPPLIEGIARLRIAQAMRTYVHSMDITMRMLTELRLEVDRPEVIIRPCVHEYGLLDNVNPDDLIRAGYEAALEAVPRIRKSLSWMNTVGRILKQPARRRLNPTLPKPASTPPAVPPTVPDVHA